jgi:hypothetical protein
VRSEHHVHNPHCGLCDNRERHILSLEGPGPKAFGSNLCDVCFPKNF